MTQSFTVLFNSKVGIGYVTDIVRKRKVKFATRSRYLPVSIPIKPKTPRTDSGEVKLLHNIGWTENAPVVFESGTVLRGEFLRVHSIVLSRETSDIGCIVGHLILRAKRGDVIDSVFCSYLPDEIYFVLHMSQMYDTYSRNEKNSAEALNNKVHGYKINDHLKCDVMVNHCEGTTRSLTFRSEGDVNPALCVEVCSRDKYVKEAKASGVRSVPSKLLLPGYLPIGCNTYIAQVQEQIFTRRDVDETGYIVHFSGGIFGFVQCEENKTPDVWNTVEVTINANDLLVKIPSCIGIEKYHTDVMFKCIHQTEFDKGMKSNSSSEDDTLAREKHEYV